MHFSQWLGMMHGPRGLRGSWKGGIWGLGESESAMVEWLTDSLLICEDL
jgi:hypothetical protein